MGDGSCAFVGLGMMGLPMAKHILAGGCRVIGIDSREQCRAEFRQAGGESASSLTEVAAQVDAVIVMVVSYEQVEDVLRPALKFLRPHTLVVVASSVSPARFKHLAEELQRLQLEVVDAPVSGGDIGARDGSLTTMLGGGGKTQSRAKQLVDHYSKHVYQLQEIGQGMLLKVLHQHLAGIHVAATVEAIALCEKSGLDPQLFREVVLNSAGNSWMFEFWSSYLIKRDFSPRSSADIFAKDLSLVLEQAKMVDVRSSLAEEAYQLFAQAQARGWGKEAPVGAIRILEKAAFPANPVNEGGQDE